MRVAGGIPVYANQFASGIRGYMGEKDQGWDVKKNWTGTNIACDCYFCLQSFIAPL